MSEDKTKRTSVMTALVPIAHADKDLEKFREHTAGLDAPGWDEHDRRVQAILDKQRIEEARERWKLTKAALIELGLSERHLEILFRGNIEETPAVDAIRGFDGDGVYILSGNVGCGKTLAAHAWLLDACFIEPLHWSPRNLMMATAAWFARASRYAKDQDKFDMLAKPHRLVLDDLGVEFNDEKGSFRVDIDELLDLRWRAKKPTVITTNLTKDEFKERYGLRLYDRARESAWSNVKRASLRGAKR